tara:strand:+ start:4088 stop:4882 length:795 start_codon:yes stop_codon:yes gene_type:complete
MVKTPQLNNKVIDCPILIATSDLFLPVLKPFSYLFNEFWSPRQPVTFLGYKKPEFDLLPNFDFVSMGEQRGIKHWSDDIKTYLQSIECDYFIYTAEDMFLARPVNFNSFYELLETAKKVIPDRLAVGNAVANQAHRPFETNEYCDVVLQEQRSNYRLSLTWSMWKKDYFIKYLHDGYSQWDYEVANMNSSQYDGAVIIGCGNNYPLGHCNALQTRGNVEGFDFANAKLNFNDVCSHEIPVHRTQVDQAYVNDMINLGLIGKINQ